MFGHFHARLFDFEIERTIPDQIKILAAQLP